MRHRHERYMYQLTRKSEQYSDIAHVQHSFRKPSANIASCTAPGAFPTRRRVTLFFSGTHFHVYYSILSAVCQFFAQ